MILRAFGATACAAALLFWLEPARAESGATNGTGIAGGALLGAELTLLTETAFGVKTPWSYVLGAAAGGALGGSAGYFASRATRPEVADYIFATSIALLIPSVVWMSRAHEPDPRNRGPRSASALRRGSTRSAWVTPSFDPNADSAPASRTAAFLTNLIGPSRDASYVEPANVTVSVVLARGSF